MRQRGEINKLDEKDNEKAIYSKEECYNTFYRSKINIPFSKLEIEFKISTGLDVRIFDNFSNETLFWDFENTAELYFARSELQENLERMIAKFKRNEGGIYEDEVLTKAIIKNPATTEYCKKIEDYIIAQLKSNFSELEKIEDKVQGVKHNAHIPTTKKASKSLKIQVVTIKKSQKAGKTKCTKSYIYMHKMPQKAATFGTNICIIYQRCK